MAGRRPKPDARGGGAHGAVAGAGCEWTSGHFRVWLGRRSATTGAHVRPRGGERDPPVVLLGPRVAPTGEMAVPVDQPTGATSTE